MAIRVTIMLDEYNAKKLRTLQAEKLSMFNRSVSLSRVLNEVLRKSL